MESKDKCEAAIQAFNGKCLPGIDVAHERYNMDEQQDALHSTNSAVKGLI